MRILLDECLPRKLKNSLAQHSVATVPEMGWSGIKDGSLLRIAEPAFDVFLTADQNLTYQQNLSSTSLCVIVLIAQNNRLSTLLPLVPELLQALETALPATALIVGPFQ